MNDEYLQPHEWQFSDQITRGVEYLNEHDPLWYEKADFKAEDFNMRDVARDVVRRAGGDPDDIPRGLGFFVGLPASNQLTREWRQTIESLRTRPDWSDLPAKANVLVQNGDGTWCPGTFTEAKAYDPGTTWNGSDRGLWLRDSFIRSNIPNPAWRATLTRKENTMTQITTQQAYQALFEDFKARVPVGSTVRLVRHWINEDAQRWGSPYPGDATSDLTVGEDCPVSSYTHNGAIVHGWNIPITCLEVISTKPKSVNVRLNSEYTAEVHKDKIVVGCQEFDIDILDKLFDALTEVSER